MFRINNHQDVCTFDKVWRYLRVREIHGGDIRNNWAQIFAKGF